VTRRIPLGVAYSVGAACEAAWAVFRLGGEPTMTRFVASELARDHWFNITAARRDLEYTPRVTMAEGTAELIGGLRRRGR
jgi:nucleoside-diphosphate-sugar epimerase